jgi:CheY-like chemotaxis protein
MDISMPVMDGYESASAIRSLPGIKSHTPIIAMTALAVPEQSRTYSGICW